jgi:hypothetical protein
MGKGKLMRVPTRVTPSSSQNPPLVEAFENTYKSWKEKHGHGSQLYSKPRITVLVTAISSLTD